MYRIDELITEINADEVVEITGEMSQEQRSAIEQQVLSNIQNEVDAKRLTDNRKQRKYFLRRKRSILILAAALILTLGITAFAARQNEWDIALINFMGLNKSDVLQLDGGEVIINETTSSQWTDYANHPQGDKKTISIIGITSIGDKNSAYLRINTDYNLPRNFNATTDYILPENTKIDIIYKNIFGHSEIRTFGSTFTAIYEEGKMGFLVSIENCENLNKCNISMLIENLYWHHDLGQHEVADDEETKELLCAGAWEMNWRFSYKSNVRKCYLFNSIVSEDGKYLLTKAEISPISIRIEAIRHPKDRKRKWTEDMIEEICYNNGECIEIKRISSGGMRNGIFKEEFVNVGELGEVLRPDEIDYLVICGEKVAL